MPIPLYTHFFLQLNKNHKIMDEKKKKKTKIKIKIEYLEMLFCEDIQATWTISNN